MNQTWLDGLQLFQIVGTLLLVGLGLPAYSYWKLRRQAAINAERAERAEALLRRTLAALDATQRQTLVESIDRPRPLDTPPAGVLPTLQKLHQEYPTDPYAVAIGWELVDDQPEVVAVSLHGDSPIKAGHTLLTGETDWGKDGLAFLIAASLCARTTPRQLQIFWIDGKGPDGALWRGKAHNWREPVTRADAIAAALTSLETERERRALLLEQHAVTKWEELPDTVRPPLLWVFVSELKLLKKPLGGELETWLERELSSARAGGIRYCIATQTVTNMKTEWRSQISCAIAGGQSSKDGDRPNLGLATDEIRDLGAIPPSALPAPGYFTVRVRREVATVRAPKIDLTERKALLARLPSLPSASPIPSTPSTAPESPGRLFPTLEKIAESPAILASVEDGRPEGWTIEHYQQVVALLGENQKSDSQIVATVWGVTGGRRYRPLVDQVAAVRHEVGVAISA